MEEKSNPSSAQIKELTENLVSDYNYFPFQDEIKGHYSRYFEDSKSPPLPSQHLELDVDSDLDCNGEG